MSVHAKHAHKIQDRRKHGRLVVTVEHMTSKCTRSSKGEKDDFKKVFVLSNVP